jgi:hypothetical protein
MTKSRIASIAIALCTGAALTVDCSAQIVRHPTGVNVNAMGATTVFLTFGNLAGRVPVEALWCGALVPATPDVGDRCDPATIFGRLPLRHDLSRPSGTDAFTDIMSIPASVARRAYQAAARGEASEFFYVRRFVDPAGGPDEYVTVTCRLGDGGARTPFSLSDVRLGFVTGDVVAAVSTGSTVPAVTARIRYNGSGRLRGRWEIVRPGEDPPSMEDLLPEASLPLELRIRQRRYTEIERFDVLLPPVGEYVLPGPAAGRLPVAAPGEYMLLLRVEASDDKEGDSQLPVIESTVTQLASSSAAAAGAAASGHLITHSGGVAGFVIPPLRYHVGAGGGIGTTATGFRMLEPADRTSLQPGTRVEFRWHGHADALFHRLEITTADGSPILAALLPRDVNSYTPPPGFAALASADTDLRWRVAALGTGGRVLTSTPWRLVSFR